MIPVEKSKARANPTKAFFVRMITRDITLEDCIFDLIDNSVDGAWERAGGRPMSLNNDTDLSAYKISIEIDQNRFLIKDNCGGISLDDAVNYAFTFGRRDDADTENFSIGVYGIGMKRAVFKLGSSIDITSTYVGDDGLSSFKVPVNVSDWLEAGNSSWDFDIDEADDLDEPGVCIEVQDLSEATAQSFASPRFVQDLRRAIARDYALHLHRGLVIDVQGKPIKGWSIEMRQGGDFSPMRESFKEKIDGEDVFIELLAGMEALPPDDSDPEGDWDENQNQSGWYVVCNGRIVLAADKTSLTGWGTDNWPQWHPQYSGFMGIIIFSSRRADLLPLTTTKRSVDATSPLYRRYRSHMREPSKTWIAYTNARKQSEREQVAEKESKTKAVPIFEVSARSEVVLPQVSAKKRTPEANVSYSVPKPKLLRLATALGNIRMTYKDVGLKSFEYAYDDLVGEE
ncbi:ATP-binding protein [Paracoccus sp. C2R09]|nr:ATP-binding protein [Paracoccus sp. C2R09]MBU2957594.1 ATP-binding protein [Paracoccus sp. C2R09]